MSKPMKKRTKAALIVLVVIAMLGACFGTVGIYAKKELNKPKFKKPEAEPLKSVTELPEDKADLCAYVNSLWEKALAADNAEGSWHTDVNLEGELVSQFKPSDSEIITLIKDRAAGDIAALYPSESDIKISEAKSKPVMALKAVDIDEFTAEQGHTDEEGNVSEDGFYFITFKMKPESVDTEAMLHSRQFSKAKSLLKDALSVKSAEFVCEKYEIAVKIDRIHDQILSVDISKDYQSKFDISLTDKYSALLEDGSRETAVSFPYKTADRIGFKWYGAEFTERDMVVQPGDIKALPAAVTVNSEATADDYKLKFEPSQKGIVSIDETGVMTVEELTDEPLIIKMILEYEGHTYTDELTLYVTELEEETNV